VHVWVLLASLTLGWLPLLCAAAGSDAPIAGLPFRYCKANAPLPLEKALCEADSTSFWEQTKELMESQNVDQQRLAVRILEKVWRKDRSLGEGLPWKALSDDDFEAFVVELLAPAVRDAMSDVPLKELQQFAIRYRLLPSGREHAIVLIGLTDAPGQMKVLASIVRDTVAGRRRAAMLALGTMCDSAAKKILNDVVMSADFSSDDKKVAQAALDERQSNRVLKWCSNPPRAGEVTL
jgi:hypothetical protein